MTQYHDLDSKELINAAKYFDFIKWCTEEGWEPYDANDIYVSSTSLGDKWATINVTDLFREYKKTWPQSVKDKI